MSLAVGFLNGPALAAIRWERPWPVEAEGYTTKLWAGVCLHVRHSEVPGRELGYLTLDLTDRGVRTRCGDVGFSRFSRKGRVWRDDVARIVKAKMGA